MLDLGALGSSGSAADGINASGQVLGLSFNQFWETRSFLWQSGVMQDLGTLYGNVAVARGINSSGQIVGYSGFNDDYSDAFLYSNGVMTNLNTLIPPASGWSLPSAAGINDAGQIVGWGVGPTGERAVRLDPVAVQAK